MAQSPRRRSRPRRAPTRLDRRPARAGRRVAAPRTCTSPSAPSPSSASTAGSSGSSDFARLSPDDTQRMLYRILSTEQQKHFEIKRQIDISYSIPGLARFRVNVYFQRESLGAAFRLIPAELKTLEQLGLPPVLKTSREAARPRPRHGPDRLGQVDDARGDDRRDQPHARRPHHDDRGPDRVPPPPQELHRQPARDRARRDELRRGAPRARSARTPT